MSNQQISIKLIDNKGNLMGTLNINELGNYEASDGKNFKKKINNCDVCFKNVPEVTHLDKSTPLLYKNLIASEGIFILEETNYQLIFTPNTDKSKIRFPTIEDYEKINIFIPLTFDKNIYGGILNFKSYVGNSFFDVEINGIRSIKIPFEVRSKKMDYEKHYPAMIADLSQAASGLLFYDKSPTFHHIDFKKRVKKSFYEDFMFLEYIFRPENLISSYEYIRRDPHKILEKIIESVPTAFASSVGPSVLIDITSNQSNLLKPPQIPQNWPLEMEEYFPKKINQKDYVDTIDTPENRFVKYFLEELSDLISEMTLYIASNKIEGYPAQKTGQYLEIIHEYLLDAWLKEVGELRHLPSNSQVLQKKEGYRDILNYFLIFELTFNIQWEEVRDDIKGYQKKLSELYEYWCYLKLTNVLNKLQKSKENYESIFDFNEKEWSIKISRNTAQNFIINTPEGDLDVKLTYNNSYSKEDPECYAYGLTMRPDYSLTITNDSKKFLIHFDAKYKCDLNTSFKNDDIYKMHTYKDSIRNTLGAYVLYPGKNKKIYREFTKNIPSVGAFPLTPGKSYSDENKIEKFLKKAFLEISQLQ